MFTSDIAIFLLGLIAAIFGGYFGAAIGGNFAFTLTGFMILFSWGIFAVGGSDIGFNYVAFGPVMGPHITFAAGVAGAAYAMHKGLIESGRDASSPLARLGRLDVLLVGAAFGAFGYLFNIGLSFIPWFGSHIDTVALTVFTSNVLARLIWGNGLLSPQNYNKGATSFMKKIAPNDTYFWLRYQEKPGQYLPLGFFAGGMAAAVSIMLAHYVQGGSAWAQTLPFAISAIIIGFLILGAEMPVQHHITIIGGLAAVKFMPVLAGAGFEWNATWTSATWMVAIGAVLIGCVFGMISAFLGEFQSQLFHQRGTTHVDPPAAAIWVSTLLVLTLSGN
ncbi:MAG: hypothetical protein R2703_14755 [Micropruina glycogenica]|jgi:hypothetical protein|nr:hypothetical protein [Propionibacteriaceae bacterium]